MSYCNATPAGSNWPVCALEEGHDPLDPHESADFYWLDGESEFHLKSDTGG